MIAKLISECDALIAVTGSEDIECLENAMLLPSFNKLMAKVACDLHDARLKNRHIVRIKVQVHAEDKVNLSD